VAGAALVLGGCGGGQTAAVRTTAPPRSSTAAKTVHPRRHRDRRSRLRKSRVGWHRYTGPVPILVYHDLGTPPPTEPWPGLYTRYPVFRREVRWLHERGYEAVTLDSLMRAWYHHGLLPRKPIVITFDNGYPPQVTFAPRVLGRFHWPAVLNEITEDHLTDAQIRHVLRLGWEVDSHSLTHPNLTALDPSQLRAQVLDSRRFLRRTFHIPVNSFCYPSSEYDAAVIAAVRAAGYTNAVTEGNAYATRSDPYLLPRFEMTAGLPQLIDDLAQPH
jgi:peptidoglycan/xylan/chitin deacetylase (PgdA/CDA1 family)